MKEFFLITLTALVLATRSQAAELPAKSLLFYREPPAQYVELLRISAIRPQAYYSNVILRDGQARQIKNDGIIAQLEFPPTTSVAVPQATARAALAKAQELAIKYPQYRAQLNEFANKWQNTLTGSAVQDLPHTSDGGVGVLSVKGVTYTDSKLVCVAGGTATIEHSAGVAHIPLPELTPDQISLLNSTSFGTKIQPSDISGAATALAAAAADRVRQSPASTLSPTAQPPASGELVAEPPNLIAISGPGYGETIQFINEKLAPFHISVGFSSESQKMVYRRRYTNGPGYTATFNPKDLDPEVRYEELARFGATSHSVILLVRNRQPLIAESQFVQIVGGGSKVLDSKQDSLTIPVADRIDAKKIANAFSHLIQLFGGHPDAF